MACKGVPAFRRLAANALAARTASDPAPAQQAIAKIVDLACDMKRYDYLHSDGPVEAAKFVVPAGRQANLDFAVKVSAELPSRAREIAAERARTARYAGTT